jgi:SAM-dependent methyltransferase
MGSTINDTHCRQRDYERRAWSCGLGGYRAVLRRFIESATPARILDVGCGAGQWPAAATEEGMAAIGIEPQVSERALRERDRYGYRFVRSRAEGLPFRDNCFVVGLLQLVLAYLDVELCLQEGARVLRENGRVHGVCYRPAYYLSAAWNEALRWEATALRRAGVLVYTLLHRATGLRRYRFETLQTPGQIRAALIRAGFGQVGSGLGGHPFDRRLGTTLLPIIFFWFQARRARVSS